MATATLDNGADIRHVHEILGHGQITSTQRYMHVSITRLHAVHASMHPAARLGRRSPGAYDGSQSLPEELP